jgi:hypothetical protein
MFVGVIITTTVLATRPGENRQHMTLVLVFFLFLTF